MDNYKFSEKRKKKKKEKQERGKIESTVLNDETFSQYSILVFSKAIARHCARTRSLPILFLFREAMG